MSWKVIIHSSIYTQYIINYISETVSNVIINESRQFLMNGYELAGITLTFVMFILTFNYSFLSFTFSVENK